MKTHQEKFCDSCGQSTGYYSTVNSGIVKMLQAVARAIEAKGINVINVKSEMVDTGKLSVTAYHNLSHMTRLGLVAKIEGEKGNYCLTSRAMLFLSGHRIPRYVRVEKKTKTHGSRKVESADDMVAIEDFRDQGTDWSGIGFEITEGRVITKPTVKGTLI